MNTRVQSIILEAIQKIVEETGVSPNVDIKTTKVYKRLWGMETNNVLHSQLEINIKIEDNDKVSKTNGNHSGLEVSSEGIKVNGRRRTIGTTMGNGE
jgi:hypothetical protein